MGAAVCIDTVGANASGNAMPSTTGKLLLQAGAATALPWALGEKRGVVSIVDVYGPTDNLVPIGNLMNKGITMRGNQTSVKRLLPRLIEYVQAGSTPKASSRTACRSKKWPTPTTSSRPGWTSAPSPS